ncbi:Suppressor of G2 allele of skp1 [Olea europaea subsp. europaea]|uniref:Suppressor of G2 allele of skp1 n=1 Tax=Olea europaea subsp. europaea TaxID=158383 RepID=A0A8S0QK83_OLEEU|nr:Suppressor of G2 allele of skp1 [Olea europaea subsp. europaea]
MVSSSDLQAKAKDAFIDDHFELAVDLYSLAIALSPNTAELFADRAQANNKLRNFNIVACSEAVADANMAIQLDPSMAKAYLRKGMACIELEEFQTAKTALQTGASLAPEDLRFINLIKECNERIAEEAGELLKQLVDEAPSYVTSGSDSSGQSSATPSDATGAISLSNGGTPMSSTKLKYKHIFCLLLFCLIVSIAGMKYYQKHEEIVVTIFAKRVLEKNIVVDFGEQILSVTIHLPGEDANHFQPRLFGKINPSKCRYEVMSTKVEIRLAKADSIHWTSLEFRTDIPVVQRTTVSSGNQRPTYPSSKPKRVDWDKLEAQVKEEEKEEQLDGDAALNKFFRGIYQDADEDMRRAMSKSFVESHGTVLSTNWKDVGSKKVIGSPPDGLELKKWEY